MKVTNMLDIRLSQIQIFRSVAEHESITKAADSLHLSESMVSKTIRSVENSLGLILFIRDRQRLRLTPAGKILRDEFSSTFDSMQKAIEKAHAVQAGDVMPIVIGLPDSANLKKIFLETKEQIQAKNTGLAFHIECLSFQELNTQLMKGDIDIVVTCGFDLPSYNSPDIKVTTLPAGNYFAYMSLDNPLAERTSLTIRDLKASPFLMLSPKDTPTYEQHITSFCIRAGFRPLISRYLNSPNAFVCNFDSGEEIFLADAYMRDSENRKLRCVPLTDVPSTMIFLYKKTNANPMVPYIYQKIVHEWKNLNVS